MDGSRAPVSPPNPPQDLLVVDVVTEGRTGLERGELPGDNACRVKVTVRIDTPRVLERTRKTRAAAGPGGHIRRAAGGAIWPGSVLFRNEALLVPAIRNPLVTRKRRAALHPMGSFLEPNQSRTR